VWYKKLGLPSESGVQIRVNGNTRELSEPLTLAALLAELNLPARRVAVERNREVVRRDAYDTVRLCDGDVLEIVQIVGGG
jgi:thiamine biosynthesis protein ThiS